MQRGIQQVQLRSNVKTEEEAMSALRAVKEAGFAGVELNRFMTHKLPATIRLFTRLSGMAMGAGGNLPWKEMLAESGLSVIALHSDLGTLEKNLEDVLKEAASYGTRRIVLTGMYHFDYSDDVALTDLIARLNRVGQAAADRGYDFLYHNHNCEFVRIRENSCKAEEKDHAGMVAYDRIIAETDPALVSFEFDAYWPAEAGADPLAWMEKLGRRQRLLHLCDRGTRPAGATASIRRSGEMELGQGNMPLGKILAQAKENACQAVILEQHDGWMNKNAISSLQVSGAWLETHLGEMAAEAKRKSEEKGTV